MKQLIHFGLIVFLTFLCTETASAQSVPSDVMEYTKRIELAKNLLAEVREKAIADASSMERKHYFTKHWAELDPAWTANFIIENLFKEDPDAPAQGQLLYDNDAVRILMARPAEIDDSVFLKLYESQMGTFLSGHYAIVALKNLPAEKAELKARILRLALESINESPSFPGSFGSQLELAALSDDPADLEQARKRIDDYYESGAAKKAWDAMVKIHGQSENNLNHFRTQFARFAPEKFKSEYETASKSLTTSDIHRLLQDESINSQEKISQLQQVKKFEFGKLPMDQMMAAASLGSIAILDHELAMKWAEAAPNPTPKIWAMMTIAPSVAKSDQPLAAKMIVECYDDLLLLDSSERNYYNSNFSAAIIGARGLPLVAAVDPVLMEGCIDKTIRAINPLRSSRMGSATEHVFQTIAAIARYDRGKAEALFDEFADDVEIRESGAFFRALMALHPDQVWDEYQEMPKQDSRGIDFRIYVRNELLPALTKQTDIGFWTQLNNSGISSIEPKILVVTSAKK